MLLPLALALTLFVPQGGQKPGLPDTPQGRRVAAYLAAFNSGDEAKFVQAHEEHFAKSVLDKISVERRKEMFKKMRGDFARLSADKVTKATDRQIVIETATTSGDTATFTFDFEEAAPHKISGIGVDVRGGE